MAIPLNIRGRARAFVERYGEHVMIRNYEFDGTDGSGYGDAERVDATHSPYSEVPARIVPRGQPDTDRDAGRTQMRYDATVYLPATHPSTANLTGVGSDGPPSEIVDEAGLSGQRWGTFSWGGGSYATRDTETVFRVQRVESGENGLVRLGVVRP